MSKYRQSDGWGWWVAHSQTSTLPKIRGFAYSGGGKVKKCTKQPHVRDCKLQSRTRVRDCKLQSRTLCETANCRLAPSERNMSNCLMDRTIPYMSPPPPKPQSLVFPPAVQPAGSTTDRRTTDRNRSRMRRWSRSRSRSRNCAGLDWTGLDWTGLDWTGDWT